MQRNAEGRLPDRRDLLLAGPVKPERGWPQKQRRDATVLRETKSCRTWLRTKLKNKQIKKAGYQTQRQLWCHRERHWSYLKLILLQNRDELIQKSFRKTTSTIMCIQRNKYQIRMLTRLSLTGQHKAKKRGKCNIQAYSATKQSHSLFGIRVPASL